ncbi:McrC family protein [Agromyces silvae]|uniref:McrC family protein n=1 Tax=Agromyces silvae TaxID=3388266 RepID=UPI00280C05AF|nr:restriction endonuclease [Agromyces protaetiae]
MSELRRIQLDESAAFGVRAEFTRAEAAALSATGFLDLRPDLEQGWMVRPAGLVGAVRAGDVQVEVWPKRRVKLGHLVFMLGYAADPGFRPETVEAERYDELWPALAESLARLADHALMHGVLQGYRTVDESSMVVRGRIRVGDQLRARPGRAVPLEVSYDDYLVDIAENQILRTALRRMSAVPGIARGVRARLAHLDNRLSGVAVLRPNQRRPEWRATRLNERYHPVLRLAEVILANSSAQNGNGGIKVAAFAVSMWKVFEDFVTVALGEAFARRGARLAAQYRAHLDTERTDGRSRVPMAVDLVHLDRGIPRTVLDAKYKAADASGRYPNADKYQMLAYCTALEVTEALLVYAQGGEAITRRVIHSGVEIAEVPLDLAVSPRESLAAIDRIASAVLHRSVSGRIDLDLLSAPVIEQTPA